MYYVIGSTLLAIVGIILLIAALAVAWSYNWTYYLPGIDSCYGAGTATGCSLNPAGTDNGLIVATLLGLGASMLFVFGAMALFGKTYNLVNGVSDLAVAPINITKSFLGGGSKEKHYKKHRSPSKHRGSSKSKKSR